MNYKKILVAYDGSASSNKAVEKAKELAKNNEKIKVDILSVFDIPIPPFEVKMYEQMLESQKTALGESVDEAKKVFADLSNEVNGVVLQGYPSNTIVQFAKENQTNLIIIGSKGLRGVQHLIMGSVSYYVVQKAPCDVYVVNL